MRLENELSRRDFETFDPEKMLQVVQSDLYWYAPDTPVGQLIDQCNFRSDDETPQELMQVRDETLAFFSFALAHDLVRRGNLPAGFNDDDRWHPVNWDYEQGCGLTEAVEKDRPDRIIIHHTNTNPDISVDALEALGLLRLYVPELRRGFPYHIPKCYQYASVNSGHFRNGRETFVGYHRLVREDGRVEELLKTSYTGFHSGVYSMNCRSIALAIAGNLTDRVPSSDVIDALAFQIARLEEHYYPDREQGFAILGHQDVIRPDGTRAAVNCPGQYTWDLWKDELIDQVRKNYLVK
ncbi:N-acetylmuramoyl-L-alanine amidase [Candidatus Roizmanbacteria bacterium]|nr:N-acetylmuramoyl-L-alanine amidase [Candidatus Roizmanbacteria bacterium]